MGHQRYGDGILVREWGKKTSNGWAPEFWRALNGKEHGVMSEKQLQASVVKAARALGWRRRRTP